MSDEGPQGRLGDPTLKMIQNMEGEQALSPPQPMTANITIQCPDQTGVVAAVAQLLHGHGINILETDQYTDPATGIYFQRLKVDYSLMIVGPGNTPVLEKALGELASRYNMEWTISYSGRRKRVAIMVSKDDHCLYDLLIRHRSEELECEVAAIISNHLKLKSVADMFGVPFHHFPIPPAAEGGKRAQEIKVTRWHCPYLQSIPGTAKNSFPTSIAVLLLYIANNIPEYGMAVNKSLEKVEALLEEQRVDLIVLARYMQILTKDFCDKHWKHTINIHHSFLPAFMGAKPYHKAHVRGVKIIGATAHYATTDLDAGPIIEQAVTRISHNDSVTDMIRKGRDLERVVLARAVRWHLSDSVLVHGNKTVVFGS